MKLEKAQRFPILVCHNVIVDGKRAELPLGDVLDGQPAPLGAHFRRRRARRRSCLLRARAKAREADRCVPGAGAGETGRGKRRETSTCAAFPRRCITAWIRAAISRKVTF